MTTSQELSLLSIRGGQVAFDEDQKKALIDVLRVRHATDADLAVFFHLARRTGLDPFRRQLYCIARKEWDSESNTKVWRQTYQTGIDGYRVIAERYAARRGKHLRKARFEYWDSKGAKSDVWWKEEPPAMIRASVQMGDDDPVVWDARFSEYVPLKDEYEPDTWADGKKTKGKATGKKVPQGMWAQRPTAQLEKCAEAGALRRCCPEDLSNLYVDAEMERGPAETSVTTLVDDGSGHEEGRDWLQEIADASTVDECRVLYKEATKAGERSPEVTTAISDRAKVLHEAEEPVGDAVDDTPNPDPEGEPAAGTPIDAPDGHDIVEPKDPEPMDVGVDPWQTPADA